MDGFDILGIINWIVCNVIRILRCDLGLSLQRAVEFLSNLIRGAFSFFGWGVGMAEAVVAYVALVAGDTAGYVGGHVSNVVTAAGNGLHDSGAADALNRISGGMRDLPIALENGLSGLVEQFQNIFDTGGGIIGFVQSAIRLVEFIFSAFGFLISLIPILIDALAGASLASDPGLSTGPICSNPSELLYYPCLGFYVLDNTIFQGPAGAIIPAIAGFLSLNFVAWLIFKLRQTFGGG
jgi:hypothetical protein